MAKKEYDDDDGRTIASMSELGGRSFFGSVAKLREEKKNMAEAAENKPEEQMDSKDRRHYVFGAMSAGLLIGLIYLVIFAIAIIIMILVWRG